MRRREKLAFIATKLLACATVATREQFCATIYSKLYPNSDRFRLSDGESKSAHIIIIIFSCNLSPLPPLLTKKKPNAPFCSERQAAAS